MKPTARVVAGAVIAAGATTLFTARGDVAGADTELRSGVQRAYSPDFTAAFLDAEDDQIGIIVITYDSWSMADAVAWQQWKTPVGRNRWLEYDKLTQDYFSGLINPSDIGDPDNIWPTGVETTHGDDGNLIFQGNPNIANECGPFTSGIYPSYEQQAPCEETTANFFGHAYFVPQVVDQEAIGSLDGNYFYAGVGYNSIVVMDGAP